MSIDTTIRAIVESYVEQSASLQEINMTITHMDQSTQQNAAMVEETNAASQELMSQGQILKNAVGRFRLSNANQSFTPAPAKIRAEAPAKIKKAAGAGAAAAAAWEEF